MSQMQVVFMTMRMNINDFKSFSMLWLLVSKNVFVICINKKLFKRVVFLNQKVIFIFLNLNLQFSEISLCIKSENFQKRKLFCHYLERGIKSVQKQPKIFQFKTSNNASKRLLLDYCSYQYWFNEHYQKCNFLLFFGRAFISNRKQNSNNNKGLF